MEIHNIFNPVKEMKDGKPEVLAEVAAEVKAPPCELEHVVPEDMDFSCVQLPENSDKAVISEEGNSDKSDVEAAVREIEKLLQKLSVWKPSVYGSIETGLEQLKEMYMQILKQIVQLPENKMQTALLNTLEIHMLKNLEGYAVKNFGSLESFFRQYGVLSDRTSLLNSLFKAAVGRALPPDKVNKFLEVYSSNPASGFRNMRGARPEAVKGSPIEGIMYQKHQPNPPDPYRKAFSGRKLMEADYLDSLLPSSRKNTGVSEPFSENNLKNGGIYRIRDLKITEKFLEGYLGDGDLLRNTGITGKNSQIKGFLAAATWAKADMFLQASGIQKGLISSLVQAIDKMVHTYIAAVSEKERPASLEELPKNTAIRVDNKELPVYNAYYEIKLFCQKEKNKGKALSSALRYAYTEFTKQKEKEGFFFEQLGREENDCKKGFIILKENWKRFVSTLPISEQKKRELEASFYSPWGDYVSPLNPLYNPELGMPVLIGGAVLIGIIILVSIFT